MFRVFRDVYRLSQPTAIQAVITWFDNFRRISYNYYFRFFKLKSRTINVVNQVIVTFNGCYEADFNVYTLLI